MKIKSAKRLAAAFLALFIALCLMSVSASATEAGYSFLPSGVGVNLSNNHTYHTNLILRAEVTVLDAAGNTVETETVTKETGFQKGGVPDIASQYSSALQQQITDSLTDKGTVTWDPNFSSGNLVFDHFESATLYTFTPADGDEVYFGQDSQGLAAAEAYFGEHQDAIGTFKRTIDVHEYQIYTVTYPVTVQQAAPQDTPISSVNLNGVSNELWSYRDVTFASLDDGSNYTIESQKWFSTDNTITPSSESRKPIAGAEYTFIITLRANDGYFFPSKSEEASVFYGGTLSVNGIQYDNGVAVIGSDGKSLSVTMFPLTKVKGVTPPQDQSVDEVIIDSVKFDYQPGDAPQYSARRSSPDSIDIMYECWEEIENGVPVAFWYSDDSKNAALGSNLITQFEAGKTYMYSILLKTKDGYIFSSSCNVMVNGSKVDPKNVQVSNGSRSLLAMAAQTIRPAVPEYKITEGDGSVWTQKSGKSLTFRANGDLKKLTGVKVDSKLLSADQYTAESGSTVVTLKGSFLKTLSVGKHTLTVVYSDGDCSASFEVKAAQTGTGKDKVPKTGDSGSLIVFSAVLLVSGTAMGIITFDSRKKNRR